MKERYKIYVACAESLGWVVIYVACAESFGWVIKIFYEWLNS